jgi:hypothetical protein
MSITFAIDVTVAELEQAPHLIDCECPGAAVLVFPSGRLAWAWATFRNALPEALRMVPHGCQNPICREYSLHPQPIADWALEVNMATQNAADVLGLLGLADAFEGGIASGADLLGRVLVAQALTPADEGVPTVDEGNVIFVGRPVGYFQQRLCELRTLAQTAHQLGRPVVWG